MINIHHCKTINKETKLGGIMKIEWEKTTYNAKKIIK